MSDKSSKQFEEEKLFSIFQQLIDLIKDIFPNDAIFKNSTDYLKWEFNSLIIWKLKNDPTRPNKPSKRVFIIIPMEVVDDIDYDKHKQEVDTKFHSCIKIKFNQFNPDHNQRTPPIEEWYIEKL